jgi:hypothetical protein
MSLEKITLSISIAPSTLMAVALHSFFPFADIFPFDSYVRRVVVAPGPGLSRTLVVNQRQEDALPAV